jgi:O-antigen/teichoic acid export membrane protein
VTMPQGSRGRKNGLLRLGGFILIPLIGALSPLLVIPALTQSYGIASWASLALAQSLGSAAGVAVELGWGLNGPQRVARAGVRAQRQLFALSLSTKVMVAALLTGPVVMLTWILSPQDKVEALLMAFVTMLSALSPAWFFIGTGHPLRILTLDALPRLAANAGTAALFAWTAAPLVVYPALLFLGALTPPLLAWKVIGSRMSTVAAFGWARLLRLIAAQGIALQGRAASAVYIALPVTIVGAVSPSALVLFSAAERMQRLTLALLAAFPNALQSWVGKSGAVSERDRRIVRAVLANAVLGLCAGTAFAVFGDVAADILFGGQISLPSEILVLCGGVIAITCLSRSTGGLGLVAIKKLRGLRNSALLGAVLGPILISLGASQGGAQGAVLGEVLTELAVLTVQSAVLIRVLRS